MNEQPTAPQKPPVNPIYSCTRGPDYEPNSMVSVVILSKARDQRFFLCRVVAIPDDDILTKVGEVLTVHQNKLEPRPDWDTWQPPQPESVVNPS